MKIFWSWQSDTEGKIGRFFVRDALDLAISELSADLAIEPAGRPDQIVLDHDRKGVPGSPALAELIFRKIRTADVVVADVTPVGSAGANPDKKLINSNVAIELGYALGVLSDERLIMVLNTAFGHRADLPFDLAHKAGPVEFSLQPGAAKKTIETEERALAAKLKVALRAMIDTHGPKPEPFRPIAQIDDDPSRYFNHSDAVVDRQGGPIRAARRLTVPSGPLLFLRLLPTRSYPELSFTAAERMLNQGQVRPFCHDWSSASVSTNRWGAIAYQQLNDQDIVLNATQLHRNREIWGFDSYLPDPTCKARENGPPGIWAKDMETAFITHLAAYVSFADGILGIAPPYDIVAGASCIPSHTLYMSGRFGPEMWGPILTNPMVERRRLHSSGDVEQRAVLLSLFESFFDSVGRSRPPNFNGFPGASA